MYDFFSMLTKLKESYYSTVHSPVHIKNDTIAEKCTAITKISYKTIPKANC